MQTVKLKGMLLLEDGSVFGGHLFGSDNAISGEVVFNTGMVGYPESLTDPSYYGQILVMTYPLIGNYGVPRIDGIDSLETEYESSRVQIRGLVVSRNSSSFSHWNAAMSLGELLKVYDVPGIYGVDTRSLTKQLREKGTMLGKIIASEDNLNFYDPNKHNIVGDVSTGEVIRHKNGGKKVVVIDCGCKNSIVKSLLSRGISVIRVPWNYDFIHEDFDGVVISSGPGDPKMCQETVNNVKKAMSLNLPIFGICLGHQILALAAGADTYKLKFGHRSQNQPCIEIGSNRCYITSQNHGYAVDVNTLPNDWEPWFVNANDETNEGIRHRFRPFFSVQFHPEASPGPVDTNYLFDMFLEIL